MVKFTSLLIAAVAILATSANAQLSAAPLMFGAKAEAPLELRSTGAAPGNQALSAAEQKIILDTHNKYRARHGAKPLTWNPQAALHGNNWIQKCQFKHSGGKYGENLAAGYKDFKTGIDAWYKEVSQYNYRNPGFSMATGHFTQVVWKATRTVGCAKKFCPGSNWTIYICNYDPPGNYQGRFPDNVSPAK
ncbi:hypothetical protein EC991_000926 [Linnemannia zychae]|nr:hypothetical protein EC991_000926 [Linnemannia zychae]